MITGEEPQSQIPRILKPIIRFKSPDVSPFIKNGLVFQRYARFDTV